MCGGNSNSPTLLSTLLLLTRTLESNRKKLNPGLHLKSQKIYAIGIIINKYIK